jgi:hypothetical protein
MRTETKEFKILKFEELSEGVQKEVIERNRYIFVEYEWYDSVYGWFKDTAPEEGFDVDKIYFSGFWSQGDGAMFEGDINNNIYEYLTPNYASESYKKDFNRVLKLLKDGHIDILGKFKHFGRYYHKKSYTDSLEYQINNEHYNKNYSNIEGILEDMLDSIREHYQDLAGNLYRQLEQEHENLTSDAFIIEHFEKNEEEFLENGDLYF